MGRQRESFGKALFVKAFLRNHFHFLLLCVCCSIHPSVAFQTNPQVGNLNIDKRRASETPPLHQDFNSLVSGQTEPPPGNLAPVRFVSASFLVGAIILGLAISDSQNIGEDLAVTAVANVIDAAMPTSSTDLVAGALGESIGGVCGAASTVGLSMLLSAASNSTTTMEQSKNEAIADGDFFIVNSASKPLLEAVGVPPALASVSSIVLATIPSQLVKIGQRKKDQRIQENLLLAQFLEEEQLLESQRKFDFRNFFSRREEPKVAATDPKELTPISLGSAIDPVDIFSDILRWLCYGALKMEFEESVILSSPGLTGAFFGIVAAVSSQFYADVLYGKLFQYGPESKQQEVLSRSTLDWNTVYLSKALSSAVLFGIYEQSQVPISRYIQGTLAGGVDGCIGSASFEMCLQTYIDLNAPGPSPEAQFRALVTNLVMVGDRLQDIAGDTTISDFQSLIGAWAVSAYSYFF